MSDRPETHGPSEAPRNNLSTPSTSNDGALPVAPADPVMPAMADEEVAEAMAAMSPVDSSALSGEVMASESVAPGTELTATIVGLCDDDVFVEFNAKSQGVLSRSQFGKKESVEIGRRVDVVVERYDDDGGLLIVSRKGTIQRATWVNLSVGMLVDARATGLVKGGLEMDLQGIRAFMPMSQVSPTPMKDISILLNEKIRCEVIELDRRGKNVLLSRRKPIERENAEAREKLKAELEVGQLRRGVVKNITTFGAFVDLGGLEGLVHISDLSWSTVDNVSDVLSSGQEIEVIVLKLEPKRGRISLGLKQAQPDPWTNVAERYAVGTSLKARIIRVTDFGAFAELEPGIEGLIPLSEMGWTRVRRSADAVSTGDLVDVVVIRVEPERHRLALSMKQAQPDPWDGVLEGFDVQSLVNGRITRLADFGAFVEVAPGVEGLIHISELSDQRVRSCGDVVQVGQDVEARVLGVDRENRRISLSLKRAKEPTQALESDPSEPAKKPKKRKKPLRGGLSSHFEW